MTADASRLEDCHGVGRAGHTTGDLQRHTAYEERPSLQLLTLPRQGLQIKHLADGHAPAPEQRLMEQSATLQLVLPRFALPEAARMRVRAGDGGLLEARRVSGDSRKARVPYPLQHLPRRLNAYEVWAGPLGDGPLLLRGEGVVGFAEAAADEKDVALLEADALQVGDLLEVLEKYRR